MTDAVPSPDARPLSPLQGLDVSHYQGKIDWPAVAAAGKAFVYVKASDGLGNLDPMFAANVKGARAAGLLVGGYNFFRPLSDAAAQADVFDHVLASVTQDLPPVLDVEEAISAGRDTWLALPVDGRIAAICRWVEGVESTTGMRPVIYTRRGYWRDVLGDSGALAACPVWLADYHTGALPAVPAMPPAWRRWAFWQFTGNGKCPGVAGDCDLDLFNGSLEELKALASTGVGDA